jgi:hypothetical protein
MVRTLILMSLLVSRLAAAEPVEIFPAVGWAFNIESIKDVKVATTFAGEKILDRATLHATLVGRTLCGVTSATDIAYFVDDERPNTLDGRALVQFIKVQVPKVAVFCRQESAEIKIEIPIVRSDYCLFGGKGCDGKTEHLFEIGIASNENMKFLKIRAVIGNKSQTKIEYELP